MIRLFFKHPPPHTNVRKSTHIGLSLCHRPIFKTFFLRQNRSIIGITSIIDPQKLYTKNERNKLNLFARYATKDH